jgi:two-component system CheB/CheR fusion protein
MKSDDQAPKILSKNTFPVVGIGASAGGLDAFTRLIRAIPVDSGMAYVLVQHLDPTHTSILPAILQKATSIPVVEISDDMEVLPDHIYIIPSNKMLVANDGVLQLSPRPDKSRREKHLPIDLFFESLAEIHQSHAIGVVLSGTASDGTAGLKAIKDQGGITFAQDSESAAYDGMPQSAALAGVVDFILRPQEIPEKLCLIKQQINRSDEDLQNLPLSDVEAFKQILFLLRIRKGNDFTHYKQTTIRRRIFRRIALCKLNGPDEYLRYLQGNLPEQDALFQDFLIPVTSFFRDGSIFDSLCESVFPHIVQSKSEVEPVRVWVAGCSSGQEAYSIAICLKEFIGDSHLKVQIFATDISEPAILKARTGTYPKSDVAEISEQRLDTFFTKVGDDYRVNKDIREMCVFAVHNFLREPPFGRIDFVSCRNVLIYMEPVLQKNALTTFHYALSLHGLLLLGRSEAGGSAPELFAVSDKNDKLFTRRDIPGKFMHVASPRIEQSLHIQSNVVRGEDLRPSFQKAADDILLRNYTPPGVIVNDALEIVYFHGVTDRYLIQASGKPTHKLLKLARSGLSFELRNLLRRAKKDQTPAIKEAIPVEAGFIRLAVTIEVTPIPGSGDPHYLIVFREVPHTPASAALDSGDDPKDIRNRQLEKELAQAREDMLSITEEQEAVNERLQNANEELQSNSEELQSLNEELETSKEELQSTNEELTIRNQELNDGMGQTKHP